MKRLSSLLGIAAISASLAGAIATARADQLPPDVARLVTPDMLKARAAMQRHDTATAMSLLRHAADHGDSLAQVLLATYYFDGTLVPKNISLSVQYVKAAIHHNREPTLSMARQLASRISATLRRSRDPNDFVASILVELLPLTANPNVEKLKGAAPPPPPSNGALEDYVLHEMMSGDE